jgi:hypothetical protein
MAGRPLPHREPFLRHIEAHRVGKTGHYRGLEQHHHNVSHRPYPPQPGHTIAARQTRGTADGPAAGPLPALAVATLACPRYSGAVQETEPCKKRT